MSATDKKRTISAAAYTSYVYSLKVEFQVKLYKFRRRII